MEEEYEPSPPPAFRLFSSNPNPNPKPKPTTTATVNHQTPAATTSGAAASFKELGLAEWAVSACDELGLRSPTPVQKQCIPAILAGSDVLGVAQTGSGKTAAFALPILNKLSEAQFGVFALVIAPTRELASQLAEQFKALGAPINLRCMVAIGGYGTIEQARGLSRRPHVVIATPGRIRALIQIDPDLAAVFSRTKFLVLDEADRLLDPNFQSELTTIFNLLPKSRQTLLFSATMTDTLKSLLDVSSNKTFFFEAYEGFKTVESLKQKYVYIPPDGKEMYMVYLVRRLFEREEVRSAIVFVSTCRTCHYLNLLLEELDQSSVALHSHKSQKLRLQSLNRFKSGLTPVLIATDVASRGLDIPTVDLVINYDLPRYARDYVHRVGRTARAGRGGLSISFITERDVSLIHEIEEVIGKKLESYPCEEKEVLEDITKVFKARRVAKMKMIDDGFEEQAKVRKEQKVKALEQKGLLVKRKR